MAKRIEASVSLGITSFDHADIYGDYTTEAEFGAAFELSGMDRSSVQFITKCGIQMTPRTRSPSKTLPIRLRLYFGIC